MSVLCFSYLGGFPERARALLGCKLSDPVLRVCGGCAKDYPYRRGFGPNDKTLDLDPSVQPDYLQDARDPFPKHSSHPLSQEMVPWAGILIDPPYSEQDATHYVPVAEKYSSPVLMVRHAIDALPLGGRVGIIHYFPPKNPKNSIMVACVGIISGFNRIRVYSVFEKVE